MFSFLSMRARLSTCLFIGAVCAPCPAQTTSSGESPKLPEAPSTSKNREQAGPTAAPQSSNQSSLETLYRKSRVFPDLATNREPMVVKKKFELFVSNSVSPISVGGALLSAEISQARDSHEAYGQE